MALFKSIKDKWVKALRSGEFNQTDGTLRRDHGDGSVGYCCLGVLREVVDPNDQRSKDNEGGLLNSVQLGTYGLDRRAQSKLADMNDAGSSFDEIADYIEKRLKVVDGGSVSAAKKGSVPSRDSFGRFIRRKR